MAIVNIYLTFNGDCEKAFKLYQSVFGTEISYMGRYKDVPPAEDGMKIKPGDEERIMHVTLPISNETRLMGCDVAAESGYLKGNNFSISIDTGSKEEADQLFKGLSDAGTVIMPMNKTFWSDYFGMLTDKFGITWMISIR